MAEAKRETVTKEVVKSEEVPVIRLELTEEEATLVHAMIGGLTGNYETTYNGALQGVRSALHAAGVRGWWYQYFVHDGNSWRAVARDN